jgi:dipeptidyl aminopeptidase/acylaminoacyl peptidase
MSARALLLFPLLALVACARPVEAPRSEPEPRRPWTPQELSSAVDVSELALSPDGRELAFVSDRSGAYELWTLALDGAHPAGEPVQRTQARESVGGIAWAPDSSALVFEMDRGGDERTDLWILRRGAPAAERLTETTRAEHAAVFSPDGRRLAFVADPDKPFLFNLHVMELETRAVQQLTREVNGVRMPRWRRDGSALVATLTPDDQRGPLLVVDAQTSATRRIAPPRADGIAWPIDELPGGELLVAATNPAGFAQLARVDLARGAFAFFGPAEWDVEAAAVADDGTILVSRNVRGESEVAWLRPGDATLRALAMGGVVDDVSLTRAGDVAALMRESSRVPDSVSLVELATGATATAVAPDLGVVAPRSLTRADLLLFWSQGGVRIDVLLWRPRVTSLGSPPPAVVWVHGGPDSQSRAAFSPTFQALAEAGFAVIAPNYRGSAGYGRRFLDLNNKDWGGGDLADVIGAVDALAAAGEIDAERVGIAGGSYGGYLTLRAITSAPGRFRAAIDMYGMPDLVVDYELTRERFGAWYETEMGTPRTHPELFRARSPIHSLHKVRSPLLVLQGANDTNVPKAESDLVVERLRALGHDVEYVVYPDEGHGFTRRENRLDALVRSVDFFLRHLSPR